MNKDVSRLITRCEQYEREVGELKKEIERLKAQVEQYRPIAKGDTVEIYQSLGPKTEPDDVGFVSEVRWVHGDTVCLDVGTLASVCDVRRTVKEVTRTIDHGINVGDEVEVFQATGSTTMECDVGAKGIVRRICNGDSTVQLDSKVGTKKALGGWVSLCDVRKVC